MFPEIKYNGEDYLNESTELLSETLNWSEIQQRQQKLVMYCQELIFNSILQGEYKRTPKYILLLKTNKYQRGSVEDKLWREFKAII